MTFSKLAALTLTTLSLQVHAADGLHDGKNRQRLQLDANTDPVEPAKMSGVYGTGMIFARPLKGTPNSGVIFKSDELHLVVGNFQDDNRYSGNTLDASTYSRQLLNKINQLDDQKHYIFNFYYPYPLHAITVDSDYIITSVQEAKIPAQFSETNLPIGFDVQNGRVGNQAGPADASGRMVEVYRWSTYVLNRPICTFTLDMGGSRRGKDKAVANETQYNVYSEAGCKYLEDILPYGLELKVTFTQNYFSIDGYDHNAQSVVVDHIPGEGVSAGPALKGYTQELLNDPDFQSGMQTLIENHWKKLHPNQPLP